jgi:hypothetical protein
MITIALIGCSKTKADAGPSGYLPAQDLYSSDLFAKRVEHVTKRGLPWYILSAKCGLLSPTVQVRPYNTVITDLSDIEVAEWNLGVANQLMSELWYEFDAPKLSSVVVELHAGAKYCDPLGAILKMFGVKVVKPVASLGIGQQLAFYKSA